MQWIGWVVALIAVILAGWLARRLAVERAHAGQLIYARIDAENQADGLRANQARVLRAARANSLGGVLGDASPQLQARIETLHTALDAARRQFADYRECVTHYDAAVQYCLQPVELIFGADKASLDELVEHVEGARRKLFETRTALEKNPAHRDHALLQNVGDALQPLTRLSRGLSGFTDSTGAAAGVDVRASLDAVVDVLAERFGDRLKITRDYQPVPALQGSAEPIHEILLYLLDNAARAAGPSGRVTLSTRSIDANVVEVAITDSGEGISEEALPHLFEAFFTTRPDQASGLGLTLAQQLAAQRGGTIGVRSIRGHGATFTVTLPVRPGEAPEPVAAAPVSPTALAPGWATALR